MIQPRLASAVNPALAARLEAAHEWTILQYVESLQRARPELGATAMAVAGGHAIYTGPSPFSFAVGLGMSGGVAPRDLDRIERFYGERNVPVKIDVTPATDPSLSAQLDQRGYRISDVTSVLLLDLAREFPTPAVSRVSVRWAQEQDCDTWVEMIARLFYIDDPGPERRKNMAAFFQVQPAMNVIAYVHGKVAGVAGGMLPKDGGLAIAYGSCTLPEYRRMGVHREMLRIRVEAARAAGCDSMMVTALPGSDSERNLMRLGFEPCYVKNTFQKSVAGDGQPQAETGPLIH